MKRIGTRCKSYIREAVGEASTVTTFEENAERRTSDAERRMLNPGSCIPEPAIARHEHEQGI